MTTSESPVLYVFGVSSPFWLRHQVHLLSLLFMSCGCNVTKRRVDELESDKEWIKSL
jgi:hypothetical protein